MITINNLLVNRILYSGYELRVVVDTNLATIVYKNIINDMSMIKNKFFNKEL